MTADKIPSIIESALQNGGKRTVLHAVLAPGATTYPHYHTLFSETFALERGSLELFASPDLSTSLVVRTLCAGESATVLPQQLHYFLVGEAGCAVTMTFEPGSLNFERAMLIMRGLQRDGTYQGYSDLVFRAVLAELTNSTAAAQAEIIPDGLYMAKKAELVAKYATGEDLQRAAGMSR